MITMEPDLGSGNQRQPSATRIRKQRRMRPRTASSTGTATAATTAATTMGRFALAFFTATTTALFLIAGCLETATAFAVVSPSASEASSRIRIRIDGRNGIIRDDRCRTATSRPAPGFPRDQCRKWDRFALAAGANGNTNNNKDNNKDNSGNNENKQKSKKDNNDNNSSNNNNNKHPAKKNNHSKYKTRKSSNNPNKKNKKSPVVDPSKQKKRELMDQIKAKIKEEGEEKKKKQQQQQQQKSQQKQKQKQKPKQRSQERSNNNNNSNTRKKGGQTAAAAAAPSTKPQIATAQTRDSPEATTNNNRQQTLEDDDFDPEAPDDENEGSGGSSAKRKRLFMNPFEAGKSLRETLNSLSTLGRGLPKETKQKYFLDDRLLDGDDEMLPLGSSSSSSSSSSSPLFANRLLREFASSGELEPYVPEVLVVGATGEIGRLVVRRLLLEGRGRFRVRVLVRDLYSQTLNLLGTGVSYCQGDLSNVESLEYALTDVDKIVCVAGAPKPDESDFQRKFRWYLREQGIDYEDDGNENDDNDNNDNDSENNHGVGDGRAKPAKINDREWEQLASVLEVRSELAEQVDFVGMKNLVSAYQNVRHTDYGTSQAAKRSLFKFSEKSGDFDLFALDEDDGGGGENTVSPVYGDNDDSVGDDDDDDNDDDDDDGSGKYRNDYDPDQAYSNYDETDDEDLYADYYDDYDDDDDDEEEYGVELESRNARDKNLAKIQVRWLRNKFHNGVFVGRVPRAVPPHAVGGEAAVISSRLRAREDPEAGIDMSNFAGLILRLVSDGNTYEAFVRTGLYESEGIEYVYQFGTDSKAPTADNKSKSRFKTIRLAFENFKPVQQRQQQQQRQTATEDGEEEEEGDDQWTVPPFVGSDVRYIGFRFRSSSNPEKHWRYSPGREYQRFYMALSYIKVYRAQPEPEFVYLSDARIPPVITDGMVHHDRKLLLTHDASDPDTREESSPATLFDEKDLRRKSEQERSPEETYFKYRGEEILVKSGLSYTIVRVAGFNELSTSEASTIDLVGTNTEAEIVPVSRSEVAQVCVSALLDPSALNKIVYMTKKKVVGKNVLDEEDISAKFEGIPSDVAP